MSVPVERVWTALADGHTYQDWVVGTSHIRDVDEGFPAVGSRIHYTVGRGPIRHEGHTEVLDVDEPKQLSLEAHAWPAGSVRIDLQLSADGDGCLVVIDERPERGIAKALHNPLWDLTVRLRNVETLRRLERVAARHA
jgi:uncharacterized protein YndB with AHSA1/START domain